MSNSKNQLKMKAQTIAWFVLLSVGLAVQCKSKEDKKSTAGTIVQEAQTAEKPCTYIYNPYMTSVEWTAYKFTEKVGVKGKFENVAITPGNKTVSSPDDVLLNTVFTIGNLQINTGNPERDKKIVKYFFEPLGEIHGKITGVQKEKQLGVIQMTWNNVQKLQPFSYQVNDDTLYLKAKIDFAAWNAEKAAKDLNNACKVLHTGKDGKSVLWPEADVSVKVAFFKNCK